MCPHSSPTDNAHLTTCTDTPTLNTTQNSSPVFCISSFIHKCKCMVSCYYYIKWLVCSCHTYQWEDWQCWNWMAVGPRKWLWLTHHPDEWCWSGSAWIRATTWRSWCWWKPELGDFDKEGAGLSTHFLGTAGMWEKKLGLLYQQEQPSSRSAHALFHSCPTAGGTYKPELTEWRTTAFYLQRATIL